MTALLDLDANVALAHALALAEEAAAALADIPMDAVMGVGLGEEIVRLRSVTRRLDATTSALSERFASSHEWEADGARSAVRWLFGSGNDSWAGTHSLLGRGELMSDFPCMGGAWRAGVISAQHLDALGRVRRRYPALADDLVAVDEAIATVASRCEPREFYQRLRQLCHRVNPEAVDDRDRDQPTGLHVSMLLDGLVRIDGTLDAVLGARFMAMLESARRDVNTSTQDPASQGPASQGPASQGPVPPSPMSQRNLDALRRILDAAGAATGDLALPLVTGERPTINVTVPLEALIDEGSVEVAWLEQHWLPANCTSSEQGAEHGSDV